MMRRLEDALKRPLAALLTGLLVLALAIGNINLRISSDHSSFFSPDDPNFVLWEKFEALYGSDMVLIFAIASDRSNMVSPSGLRAIASITEESWTLPLATRVSSLTNFQHSKAVDDNIEISDLYDPAAATEDMVTEEIMQVAASDPLVSGLLISKDLNTAAVYVTTSIERGDTESTALVMRKARDVRDRIQHEYPDVSIGITGNIPLNYAFTEASLEDGMTLIPLMYAAMFLLCFWLLGTLKGTAYVFLTVALTVASAMGFAGWLDYPITPLLAAVPMFLLIIALCDAIHLMSSRLSFEHAGHSPKEAMDKSLVANFTPITLTSVTTMIGFLSLNFAESPSFREFGNVSAMGVMLAWLISLTILPIALRKPISGYGRPVIGRWFNDGAVSKWIGSPLAVWITAGLIVLLLAVTFVGSKRIELNDQYSKYFSESLEFRRDTDFARSRLNGIINIDFNIESSDQADVISPVALAEIEAFADWLRAQPSVTYVHSPVTLIKKLNQNLHGDDERYFSIPDTREIVAQYLLILELSLPRGQDTSNFITIDKSAIKLSAITSDLTAAESRALRVAAENWFQKHSAAGLTAEGMSTHLMFAYVSQNNIEGMLRGVPLALFAIAIILGWSFRSVPIGAAALVSITFPIASSFGIWGLLYGQVGTAAAVVAAVAVGIVVDDTVHFLTRYRDANLSGHSNRESAIKALQNSGPAITTSSLILTLGFLILSFSAFKVNQNMGGLMVIVTIVALFFVLVMLATIFAAQASKTRNSKNVA